MKRDIFFSMQITKSKLALGVLLGFLTGAIFGCLFVLQTQIFFLIIISALILLVIDYKNKKLLLASLFLLGLTAGMWRTSQAIFQIYFRSVEKFEGLVLVLSSEQVKDYQKIIVTKNLKTNKEKILINAPVYPKVQYGDILKLACQLKNPENKDEKFNYIRFLAKDQIYQICQQAKIEKTDKVFGSKIYRMIIGFSKRLEEKINLFFPQPEGAFMAGLLLGGSNRLPSEVAEQFRRTGTTHMVAVSGYNITIIASMLMSLGIFFGLWRQQAFWFAVGGILLFILMIGMPASAVRAAIMGALLLWAVKKGRLSQAGYSLIWAGAIMTWFSPLILLYDVGFQLSFLATAGIIFVYNFLEERLVLSEKLTDFKSMFLVTITAQIGVLGVLLYTFESISLISLLANLILLPAIAYIMLAGAVTLILSLVSTFLAKIVALPVWFLLHLELQVLEKLSDLKWAMVEVKWFGLGWTLGYYLGLVILIKYLKNRKKSSNI